MMLRPRQTLLVDRTLAALDRHGNTLAVAPTGSGKTIMLSAVAGTLLAEPDAKACILAHRTELTDQNRGKFARVNPGLSTSVFAAHEKSWAGHATFAIVQTLSRGSNLAQMPALDLLVIDETHHAASPSYRAVIDRVLARNPKAGICGLTATPNRGDGKGLREVFSNVADQITLGEMIATGHLVPPRTFVIDVGAQEALGNVRRTAIDFDMEEVAAILNTAPITQAVLRHSKQKAHERKTIVFCSTVAHAECVTEAFVAAGVSAVLIHGELSDAERKARLADYETGAAQVGGNARVYWLCGAFPDGEISPSYYAGEGTEVPSPLRREASGRCWSIPGRGNTLCLLALDLGTQTGWALRGRDGSIISGSESFRPGRFEGGGMRYLRFKRWLTEIKHSVDGIDAVYFEEVRRHAGVDAAHAYGGFLAHLTAWCEHQQIPYQGVPVGTIKKHATGKGNAGKDAMIAAARARGFDPQDDNEADALALLAWEVAQEDVA